MIHVVFFWSSQLSLPSISSTRVEVNDVFKTQNKVNSAPEVSGDTIFLPDRDAKIAELPITRLKVEVSNRVMNLRTGLRQNKIYAVVRKDDNQT